MFSYTRTSAANHPLIPLPHETPRQPIMLGELIDSSVTRTVLDLVKHDEPSLGVPQLLLSRHTMSPLNIDKPNESFPLLLELVLRAGDIIETLNIAKSPPTIDELMTTFNSFAERLKRVAHMDELKRMRPKLLPNLTDRFQGQIVELRETLERLEVRSPDGTSNYIALFSAQVSHDGDPLAGAYLWFDPATARHCALEAAQRALETKRKQQSTSVEVTIPASNIYLSMQANIEARSAGLPNDYIPLSPCSRPLAKGHDMKTMRFCPRGTSLPERLTPDLIIAHETKNLQLYRRGKTDTERMINAIFHSDIVIILSSNGSGTPMQVPQTILDNALVNGSAMGTNIVCSHPNPSSVIPLASAVTSERSRKHGASVGSVGYDLYEKSELSRGWGCITYCSTATLLKRFLEDSERFLSSSSHIIIDEIHECHKDTEIALTLLRQSIRERKSAGLDFPKLVFLGASSEASRLVGYLRARGGGESALEVRELKFGGPTFSVHHHYLLDTLSECSSILSHPGVSMALRGDYERKIQKYIQDEINFANPRAVESKSRRSNRPIFSHLDSGLVGLVASTIAHIVSTKAPGDILAFLPRSSSIDEVTTLLGQMKSAKIDFEDSSRFKIVKANSQPEGLIPEIIPAGCVRIILTAGLPSPSLTLANITYVVDSGKAETPFVDHTTLKAHTDRADLATNLQYTGLTRGLNSTWISQASMRERSALPSHVEGGHYYALYTPQRQAASPHFDRPAIQTSDLVQESLLLSSALVPYNPKDIFCQMLDPPRMEVIDNAFRQLLCLDAFTHEYKITSLGRVLAMFSLHPAVAKALILGAVFGCLEPIMILACVNPSNVLLDPSESLGKQTQFRDSLPYESSDAALDIKRFRRYHNYYILKDYDKLQQVERDWGVEHSTFANILERGQDIFTTLRRIGVVPIWTAWTKDDSVFALIPHYVNFNRDNHALVRAICLNTIHPNIAMWGSRKQGQQDEWIDASSHRNEVDPLSIIHYTTSLEDNNHRTARSMIAGSNVAARLDIPHTPSAHNREPVSTDKLSPTRQRGEMLSYHGKRIIGYCTKSRLLARLQQVSVLTPLQAILFHPTATLDPEGNIALNGRLLLNLKIEDKMHEDMELQARQVLMEFRQTINRFCRHLFSQLNMSATPGARGSGTGDSQPKNQGMLIMAPLFEGKLRRAVVAAIVRVLDDDVFYSKMRRRSHRNAHKQVFEECMAPATSSEKKDGATSDGDGDAVQAPTDAEIAAATKAKLDKVTAMVHQMTLEIVENEKPS
ncbi:uncharacterized protein A1O9_04139 [Exophiala aquamarina CBS 119918]|uniref:Helicase-associated domain-containing protein n=1 Tax=Exophiala aquamarina CBS 119918 TaxID=1182545 RepID=A0A072PUW1_9EURO|nr:uncharacterized protein A1O9_04139 [Exophiala aquamarina CBS 119918]KEF59295.1 hypothetical protein A1O9_04139 [Exophiala aquamarina CBS 119918]